LDFVSTGNLRLLFFITAQVHDLEILAIVGGLMGIILTISGVTGPEEKAVVQGAM